MPKYLRPSDLKVPYSILENVQYLTESNSRRGANTGCRASGTQKRCSLRPGLEGSASSPLLDEEWDRKKLWSCSARSESMYYWLQGKNYRKPRLFPSNTRFPVHAHSTNSGIVSSNLWAAILRPWSLSARLLHNQAVGVGEAPAKTPGTELLLSAI